MAVLSPVHLIEAVRAEHGPAGLFGLAPVALSARLLDGFDPADPQTLLARSMVIDVVIHPVVEALLTVAGATRRGALTFSMGLGKDSSPAPLRTLLDAVDPSCVLPESWALTASGRLRSGLDGYSATWQRGVALRELAANSPASRVINHADTNSSRFGMPEHGLVLLDRQDKQLYFKFHTYELECPAHPEVTLNLRPVGTVQKDPKPLRPAVAVAVLEWAAANDITVVDSSPGNDLATIRRALADSLVAWPMPGRPARAHVAVGFRHAAKARVLGAKVPASGPGSWDDVASGCECAPCEQARTRSVRLVELDVARLADVERRWKGKVVVAPAVADVADLTRATPVDDERLRPYQREVVGMHLATKLGFVNALSPGMGKTICVLDALRRRAAAGNDWRGLVVLEANVRHQWAAEAAVWFPEAQVVTIQSAADVAALDAALAGPGPVLALCSYALATPVSDLPVTVAGTDTSLAATLARTHWDDLVADEAACLRNPSSKQSVAMWRLRSNSDVAVALTGTPITRSLDDVGRLVSWVRNDAELFSGARLESTIDLSTKDGRQEWQSALGPLLVRRDKSEIADELPGLRASVVRLEPKPAERSLAHAARNELRRVYDELVAATARAQAANPDDPRWADVREQLATARGAWLGGTQLARMAASDPASLMTSESAGAALLNAQGLIEAATAETGTKRAWVLDTVAAHVDAGRQVLVFTEFASVARGILSGLADRGVAAGGVLGGGGRRRDANIAEFTAGRLGALVSTSSGERGLNLQQAAVVIHYDLPWTPDAVLQRTGRVERIGAGADEIEVVFPVMADTIEERVAALVVSRAVTAMCALDVARGVSAAATDMGRALGELAGSVDAKVLSEKESSLLSLTRELLAA